MLKEVVTEAKRAAKEKKEPEAEKEPPIPMGMTLPRSVLLESIVLSLNWNLNITHQVSLNLNRILRQEFNPVHWVTLVSKLVRLLNDLLS